MADLKITHLKGLGVASVLARRGSDGAAVAGLLGLRPPEGGQSSSTGGLTLLPTGPGAWLAVQIDASLDWAETLAERLRGAAFVADQSSAYAVLALDGRDSWALAQRAAYVDLSPDAFGPAGVAVTVIAHMGAVLWRRPGGFNVAVFRSQLGSFQAWIDAASAPL